MVPNDTMLTGLQYAILRRIAPNAPSHSSGEAYKGTSKISMLLGESLIQQLKGKVVVDFGCGEGAETVELAKKGAAKVIGIDIRESALQRGRDRAQAAGVGSLCEFGGDTDQLVDVVVSIDSFEHFQDPASALAKMYSLLKPGGVLIASFGPTWYHPYGGHLFSVFPWAHLLFSEEALIRWRSHLRSDGARRFCEVEGGLNQMTIRRFTRLLRNSGFTVESLVAVPIRKFAVLHNRLTREFTTSVVRCKLLKPARAS